MVQSSRGTTQDLARATSKFGQEFSNFLEAGVDMAGTSQVSLNELPPGKLSSNFLKHVFMSFISSKMYCPLYRCGVPRKEQTQVHIPRSWVIMTHDLGEKILIAKAIEFSVSSHFFLSSSLRRTRPRWCLT